MHSPTALLEQHITAAGYHFVKCNRTLYWLCLDDTDLSEVAAGLFRGEVIHAAAKELGL